MSEKEYIDRKAFVETQRHLYCENCERRKGMKNGKLYEVGGVPCRACDIGDMLDDVEDFPAADVRPVVRGHWIGTEEAEKIFEENYSDYPCGCWSGSSMRLTPAERARRLRLWESRLGA